MTKKDAIVAQESTFAALAPLNDEDSLFSPDEVMADNFGNQSINPNDLDRVKIPAGGGTAWEVPTIDGDTEFVKELNVIIVAQRDVRSYYSTAFDGGNAPPDCYSLDCVNGVGDPGGKCADCPFSQWGTATDANGNPTDGQACNQRKLLLCISEESTLPFLISAPPSSLKTIKQYLVRLSGAKLPFWGVVTNLTLEKVKSGGGIDHSVVKPKYVRTITKEEVPLMRSYRNSLLEMFDMVRPEENVVDAEVVDEE